MVSISDGEDDSSLSTNVDSSDERNANGVISGRAAAVVPVSDRLVIFQQPVDTRRLDEGRLTVDLSDIGGWLEVARRKSMLYSGGMSDTGLSEPTNQMFQNQASYPPHSVFPTLQIRRRKTDTTFAKKDIPTACSYIDNIRRRSTSQNIPYRILATPPEGAANAPLVPNKNFSLSPRFKIDSESIREATSLPGAAASVSSSAAPQVISPKVFPQRSASNLLSSPNDPSWGSPGGPEVRKDFAHYCTKWGKIPGLVTVCEHAVTFEPDPRHFRVMHLGVPSFQAFVDIQDVLETGAVFIPEPLEGQTSSIDSGAYKTGAYVQIVLKKLDGREIRNKSRASSSAAPKQDPLSPGRPSNSIMPAPQRARSRRKLHSLADPRKEHLLLQRSASSPLAKFAKPSFASRSGRRQALSGIESVKCGTERPTTPDSETGYDTKKRGDKKSSSEGRKRGSKRLSALMDKLAKVGKDRPQEAPIVSGARMRLSPDNIEPVSLTTGRHSRDSSGVSQSAAADKYVANKGAASLTEADLAAADLLCDNFPPILNRASAPSLAALYPKSAGKRRSERLFSDCSDDECLVTPELEEAISVVADEMATARSEGDARKKLDSKRNSLQLLAANSEQEKEIDESPTASRSTSAPPFTLLFQLHSQEAVREVVEYLSDIVEDRKKNASQTRIISFTSVPFDSYSSLMSILERSTSASSIFDPDMDSGMPQVEPQTIVRSATAEFLQSVIPFRFFQSNSSAATLEAVPENKAVAPVSITPRDIFHPRYESLPGAADLMTDHVATEIMLFLPPTLSCREWRLIFCSRLHGISFQTFFRLTQDRCPCIVFVQDTCSVLFGFFTPDPLHQSGKYYGSGETFVFTFRGPSEKVEDMSNPDNGIQIFRWSSKNHHFLFTSGHTIAVGGGKGRYALTVDSSFLRGSSAACSTFNSPCRFGHAPIFKNFILN